MKGDEITGIEAAAQHEGVEVFHAGTAIKDGRLVAAGGRVLNVCASGATLRDALKRAYLATSVIHWKGKRYATTSGAGSWTAPPLEPSRAAA